MKRAMKTVGRVALVATMIASSGCVTRLGDFTILSSKNVSVTGNRGDRVKGDSCMAMILFIPVGHVDMKSAVDKAIESAGPGFDALEDVVLKSSFLYLFLFAQSCMIVEGTAVSTKGGKAMLDNPNRLYHSSLLDGPREKRQAQLLESMQKAALSRSTRKG